MKTQIALCVAIGVIAGCAAKHEEATPAAGAIESRADSTSATPRIGTTDAIPKLAAAECEHEVKCNNVGEGLEFTSLNECKRLKEEKLTKDFNDDEACKNGIPSSNLDACVTKTADQECRASVVAKVKVDAVCGSNDLCVK